MSKQKQVDLGLVLTMAFLLIFGLVMLYSATGYLSERLYADSAYYLKRQIRNLAVGMIFLVLINQMEYFRFEKWGWLVYGISFLLCLLVLIPGVGVSANGSSRWLGVGPFTFQPSELSKIAVILFLASTISKQKKRINQISTLLVIFIKLVPLLVVIAISNLSTAVIVFGIAVGMLFVANAKYIPFVGAAVAAVVFVVFFIAFAGYRMGRIEAWLHPEAAGDAGYQTRQGLYAIGSGGLLGKGYGNGIQKLGNVPEAQNDMIFTIVCEELGLVGAAVLLFTFAFFIYRLMGIAVKVRDLYGMLLVSGVLIHISMQTLLNVAVVTNSIPNTGVILPFISYGGTSLVFLLAEMGFVMNVSAKTVRTEGRW